MLQRRRPLALVLLVLALTGLTGCDSLKDAEPWTATLTYDSDPAGKLVVTPLLIQADAAFGQVQINNETDREHGFAITDHNSAIFDKIPAGKSRTVGVTELKDDRTYRFFCQLHDEDDDGSEFTGKIVVNYLSEEFR